MSHLGLYLTLKRHYCIIVIILTVSLPHPRFVSQCLCVPPLFFLIKERKLCSVICCRNRGRIPFYVHQNLFWQLERSSATGVKKGKSYRRRNTGLSEGRALEVSWSLNIFYLEHSILKSFWCKLRVGKNGAREKLMLGGSWWKRVCGRRIGARCTMGWQSCWEGTITTLYWPDVCELVWEHFQTALSVVAAMQSLLHNCIPYATSLQLNWREEGNSCGRCSQTPARGNSLVSWYEWVRLESKCLGKQTRQTEFLALWCLSEVTMFWVCV